MKLSKNFCIEVDETTNEMVQNKLFKLGHSWSGGKEFFEATTYEMRFIVNDIYEAPYEETSNYLCWLSPGRSSLIYIEELNLKIITAEEFLCPGSIFEEL